MVEDTPEHRGIGQERDMVELSGRSSARATPMPFGYDGHGRCALGAGERVDVEDAAQELRPAEAARTHSRNGGLDSPGLPPVVLGLSGVFSGEAWGAIRAQTVSAGCLHMGGRDHRILFVTEVGIKSGRRCLSPEVRTICEQSDQRSQRSQPALQQQGSQEVWGVACRRTHLHKWTSIRRHWNLAVPAPVEAGTPAFLLAGLRAPEDSLDLAKKLREAVRLGADAVEALLSEPAHDGIRGVAAGDDRS